MRPMDKATADSRTVQSLAIIKNTGHGNCVLAVFTLELEMDYPSETSLCTVAPFPTDTSSPIFSEGSGRPYTGYLERIIHLQTVRRNWRIKSGGLFIQNSNYSIFKLRRIIYLRRIIQRITRLTRIIRTSGILYKKYNLSNVKIFQKNSLLHPEMILRPLFCFTDTKNTG